MSKNIDVGDVAVGSRNIFVDFTTNENMTGMNIVFVFIKPSGETFLRTASSISTYTARYIFATGDLDESGDWHVGLKNITNDYEYKDVRTIKVRPKAEEMAVA